MHCASSKKPRHKAPLRKSTNCSHKYQASIRPRTIHTNLKNNHKLKYIQSTSSPHLISHSSSLAQNLLHLQPGIYTNKSSYFSNSPDNFIKPDKSVVSPNLDKLRQIAKSERPDVTLLKQPIDVGETFSDMQSKQRGNYTVPSPFDSNIIDSTQRLQQNFHIDQHVEAYGQDGYESRQHVQESKVELPGAPRHIKTSQTPNNTNNNVGTVGTLGDIGQLAHDDEVQTFSRNLFYGFGANSFLINSITFHGSVIVTPTMTYLWKPKSWQDITPESLSFLHFLFPQPDVILFGCGSVPKPIPPGVHHYLRTLNVPYELLSTQAAMGTFNIMNEEYRKVLTICVAYDHDEHYEHDILKRSRLQA